MDDNLTSSQITVVTVAYNSMAVLPKMLSALPFGIQIVVIDNSPKADPELSALCDRFSARLIRNEVNLGFGAGCNQGAAMADTPFVIFLNPDTEPHEGCFDALMEATKTYPNASAFNPQILDGRGRMAFRRRSNLRPKQDWYRGPLPQMDAEVPVLSGAAIFIGIDKFDKVGGFDENIFLYYEDDDLTLRLSKLGPLMHVHNAVVQHLEGRSTVRSPEVAYFKAYHLARSRVFARTKHGLSWPKTRVIFRGFRQLLSPLMFSRRKRRKYLGYWAGAVSTLRDGGRNKTERRET